MSIFTIRSLAESLEAHCCEYGNEKLAIASTVCHKNVPTFIFLNSLEKSTDFKKFWHMTSRRNMAESYKLAHLTNKLLSHYSVKCID